jgi:chromosome segregation ATPase
LVDELSQAENMPESPPGGENPPEAEEVGVEEEATGLESLLARRTEELANANARLEELEEAIAGRDGEIASLKQDKDEVEDRLSTLNSLLAEAVASYKAMVVQANPEVIEDLISGDTIESVNESLDRAKALVSKVKQGVEAEISLAKVPAGAPERTPPDLSALSPREKIQYAIGGFSSRSK